MSLPARLIAGAPSPPARCRVQDDGVRAEGVARLQRGDERRARLGAHLLVGGRGVEQVDRVDEQRVDAALVHRLSKSATCSSL
jgi:hypothetical protein